MSNLNRRGFFKGSVAAAAGLVAGGRPASADMRDATGAADLIVTGADVLSMDSAITGATAIAVRGKHILAVGSDDDIESLAGSGTSRIDARGMTLTPGFIDAHSHPLMADEGVSANVNLRRISDVQDALAGKAAETPAGHWVRGTMYDDTKFEEERPLNRGDLDNAVPNHPVYPRVGGG